MSRNQPGVSPETSPTAGPNQRRTNPPRPLPGGAGSKEKVGPIQSDTAMLAAVGADVMVRNVSRITAKLLEWYPGGQMLAWGVSYQHMVAGRPGHMLAAACSGGWGAVQRALRD